MNSKTKITLASILILLVFVSITCSSPTETELARRDYVWTVDTLNHPYNTLYRLWGSSPWDVWATSTGDWNKSIFHYRGDSWSYYGVQGLLVPSSIYGFSRNDIYIGAENGAIWHYDGENWEQIAKLKKDGHEDIVFDNMWGESPTDFFAFGAYTDEEGYANNSVIAHFTNNKWEMLNTDGLFGIVEHLYKNLKDDKIYLQVIGGHNYTDSTHIYEYSNDKYIKLYSDIWTKGKQADISLIDDEVYFILGSKIAKRVNNELQTVLNVDNPNFYQRIWGRNHKDIFLFMTDGLVHYNGNDMEYLLHFDKPRTQIFGAMLFDNEVVFLVYESPTNLNLIYHGKLK